MRRCVEEATALTRFQTNFVEAVVSTACLGARYSTLHELRRANCRAFVSAPNAFGVSQHQPARPRAPVDGQSVGRVSGSERVKRPTIIRVTAPGGR
jgi:hypothetical protein